MGVTLADIPPDGTNTAEREKANESTFRENSRALHEELLRRARAAAGPDDRNSSTQQKRPWHSRTEPQNVATGTPELIWSMVSVCSVGQSDVSDPGGLRAKRMKLTSHYELWHRPRSTLPHDDRMRAYKRMAGIRNPHVPWPKEPFARFDPASLTVFFKTKVTQRCKNS